MTYLSFAIVLGAIGLLLFLSEYFFPTGGLLIVAGFIISLAAVAVVAMNAEDYRETVAAVVILCIGEPIFVMAGLSMYGKKMALVAASQTPEGSANADEETNPLIGRVGKTMTQMRPAGAVEFDGRRYDAVSEGMLIEAGVWVKCVEAKGTRTVVRQVAAPPKLEDINLDELK